jgi:hypothetical protein
MNDARMIAVAAADKLRFADDNLIAYSIFFLDLAQFKNRPQKDSLRDLWPSALSQLTVLIFASTVLCIPSQSDHLASDTVKS